MYINVYLCVQILRDEEQRTDYDYMLDNPGELKKKKSRGVKVFFTP